MSNSPQSITELYQEESVENNEIENCDGSVITAPSRVLYPDLLEQSTAMELTHLRRLVMGIGGHVTSLGDESKEMNEKIEEMKKNLSKANFGFGELRRKQLESINKMLMFSTDEIGVQVLLNHSILLFRLIRLSLN